jgi:hypothetical protein
MRNFKVTSILTFYNMRNLKSLKLMKNDKKTPTKKIQNRDLNY